MSECSPTSKETNKHFDNPVWSSTMNTFKHQNSTPMGTCLSDHLSELGSLASSEHSLEDWSTHSYSFGKGTSSEIQEVRSLSSSQPDFIATMDETYASESKNDTREINEPDVPEAPFLNSISSAIASSNVLDVDNRSQAPSEYYGGSFVMPQVAVPSTKESEKSIGNPDIGYMKIIVCGDSGIGKTSLINMFLNAPEIVAVSHVSGGDSDNQSICSNVETSTIDEKKSYESNFEFEGMKEILASTGEKELFDTTLADDVDSENSGPAYNICMVDTIGYGAYMDAGAIISPVTSYLEHQFHITNSMFHPMQPNTNTLFRILNNGHGAYSHVDVCLYVIFNRVKPVDYEYMRSIQHLCNIVPVLVKQDFYSTDQMNKRRYEVLSELIDNGIAVFSFDQCQDDLLEMCRRGNPGVPPFTVSLDTTTILEWAYNLPPSPTTTIPVQDEQALGSLHSSVNSSPDFKSLKDVLFYKSINSLRRSTAGKFVKWRTKQLLHDTPWNAIKDDSSSQYHEFSTITSSTLTTGETVDRLHRVKQAEVKKINLHIAKFISDKRKEMEERMIEQEQKLTKQLDSASYRRRAQLLLAELAKLLLQPSSGRAQLAINQQAQPIVSPRAPKRPSKAPTDLFTRMQLPITPPEVAKLLATCTVLLLPYNFGPWVYLLSLCLIYCIP